MIKRIALLTLLVAPLWLSAQVRTEKLLEKGWKFTREDRNKIKDYVQEHGLGKYKEQDALNGFMNEFGYCRQQ